MRAVEPYRDGAIQRIGGRGLFVTLMVVMPLAWVPDILAAPLSVMPQKKPSSAFGGGERGLEVILRNSGIQTVKSEVRAHVYQTSSATAAPVYEFAWKTLQVLPGQTIIETATLRFPAVQAETRFLVRWVDGGRALLGVTDVRVFPTNLLTQLRSLVGDSPVGVFDPANQLMPLLRRTGVPFQDLVADGTDHFFGKLAILGPFPTAGTMRGTLAGDIHRLAKRGKAAVWLQPPSTESARLRPSFHLVRVGEGVVVIAQADVVSNLSDDPCAQVNLLQLAERAIHPPRLDLAAFEPQTDAAP